MRIGRIHVGRAYALWTHVSSPPRVDSRLLDVAPGVIERGEIEDVHTDTGQVTVRTAGGRARRWPARHVLCPWEELVAERAGRDLLLTAAAKQLSDVLRDVEVTVYMIGGGFTDREHDGRVGVCMSALGVGQMACCLQALGGDLDLDSRERFFAVAGARASYDETALAHVDAQWRSADRDAMDLVLERAPDVTGADDGPLMLRHGALANLTVMQAARCLRALAEHPATRDRPQAIGHGVFTVWTKTDSLGTMPVDSLVADVFPDYPSAHAHLMDAEGHGTAHVYRGLVPQRFAEVCRRTPKRRTLTAGPAGHRRRSGVIELRT